MSSPLVQSGRFLKATRVVVLGAAAAVVLAACSSGSSASETSSGASAGGDGGTTAITVLRSTGSTFEPLYIAQDQGYFKDAGLDVTITAGAADTSQNAPSVLNNEAQFAMTDSSGILKAAAQGLPIQIASGLQSSDTSVPPSDGLVVKADSPIKSFADVGGKTIGLPALGGTLQFITSTRPSRPGWTRRQSTSWRCLSRRLNDAVANGQVDGAYVFATFIDAAKAAGMNVIGEGTNALPGLPQATLFSSTEYLQANPEVAKKFVDAVGKGIDYANAHPDAVRAVDTQYTKLPPEYIAGRTIQPFSAEINTATLQTVADDMAKFGLITKPVDTKTVVWAQAPTSQLLSASINEIGGDDMTITTSRGTLRSRRIPQGFDGAERPAEHSCSSRS